MKIYVGCALTKATEEFKEFVAAFKTELAKEPGIELLEFIGLVAGTPADVYRIDLGNVEMCDALIAFVDEPAIGIGMEIMHAIALGKPILCLLRQGNTVTRIVRGAAELKHAELLEYTDTTHALSAVGTFLASQPETPSSAS